LINKSFIQMISQFCRQSAAKEAPCTYLGILAQLQLTIDRDNILLSAVISDELDASSPGMHAKSHSCHHTDLHITQRHNRPCTYLGRLAQLQ
jgi:hypothetical protein